MHKTMRLTFVLLCYITLAANAIAGGMITRMSDKQAVNFSQMISDIEGSDVVFIAETHDNRNNHALQLDIIRSLSAQKAPLAIGLEMFQPESQKELDDWTEGKMTEQNFKEVYARNWSYDWSL